MEILSGSIMSISNQYVEDFSRILDYGIEVPIELQSCIIGRFSLFSINFHKRMVIRNCIIDQLEIYTTFFEKGLLLDGNIILADSVIEASGHNMATLQLSSNIFGGFLRVFDCQFDSEVVIEGNIFRQGTNILTKENPVFDNRFDGGCRICNNVGKLDVWK
ncbi:MAG: hypothetical protein IJ754_07770 [Bacteroidaceae bacterium]|nr:hypothetical protein [Bacteroidaceae bacterium]